MNPNQTSSLFSEISKRLESTKLKDSELEYDETMNKRGDGLFIATSDINDVKKNSQALEISKAKDEREQAIDIRRKTNRNIKVEYGKSLKDCLTIDPQTYSTAENLVSNIQEIDAYKINLRGDNMVNQYLSLVAIRKILTMPNANNIQLIIDNGLVFDLVSLLDHNLPEFVLEAVWSIAIISSGTSDQINSIVMKGVSKKLVNLCDSKLFEIQEQAFFGTGNLAGEGVTLRDKLVNEGALDKILFYLKTAERKSLAKSCLWCLTNFSRGTPTIAYEKMEKFVDLLIQSINKFSDDTDIVGDAAWSLGYLTDNHKKVVKSIQSLNALKLIVKLLESDNTQLIMPALRIIGAFVAGNAGLTQDVVDSGALDLFPKLLNHPNKSIRKEVTWMISNIAAGTLMQVEALVAKDYLSLMTSVLKNDDQDIRKEAVWAICNFTLVEKPELIKSIFNGGILETICIILKFNDPKYIAVALESLGNLLNYGKTMFANQDGSNPIVVKIEEIGMFDFLESLQYHPVQVVYEKTIMIIEKYFESENANL